MKPAFLRLFVAIQVPEDVRIEMAGMQDELRPLAAPEGVRWVKPEQLHLTLKFLGNVPENLVESVKNSLTEACAGISPFDLSAKEIGFFPNERSPRVIWAGIQENQNYLAELQKRIAESLVPFVKELDTEKFHPHVTLGRFQKFRRHKTEKLLPRVLSSKHNIFGKWLVNAVDLMQSELSPSGAIHSVLSSVTLV